MFGLLLIAPLILSSVSSLYRSCVERRSAPLEIQREKATAAATRIGHYMAEVEPLSHIPAIAELMLVDRHVKERFKIYRLTPDAIDRGVDHSAVDAGQAALGGGIETEVGFSGRDAPRNADATRWGDWSAGLGAS